MKRLTSADLKSMSREQILAHWRAMQVEARAAGKPYYERLIAVQADGSEKIVTTIDGKETN